MDNYHIYQGVSKYPTVNKVKTYPKYINWVQTQITIDDLINFIKKGHSWCSIYSPTNEIKKTTFQSSNAIVLNIKSELPMYHYIEYIRVNGFILPTFAYTPDSKDVDEFTHSFKLVYCFSEPLTQGNFSVAYNRLMERLGLEKGYCDNYAGSAMVYTHCGMHPTNGLVTKCGPVYKVCDIVEFDPLF